MTTKPTHATWLSNVLDRVALRHSVMPGRPYFSKELAAEVQAQCRDLVLMMSDAASSDDIDMDSLAEQ